MRRAAIALAAALALGAGGCSLGDESSDPQGEAGASKPGAASGEEGAIRGWSAALNAGDYETAGSYFAPGAIVEQAEEVRLPDRKAAVAFSRSLPCRARVTDVEEERDSFIAAFDLRPGPTGAGETCDGAARVRFRFRDGKFSEWRQLAEPVQPEGPVV